MSEPGHTSTRRTLTTLPSGVPIETTVHTYEGATDGPTLYVQAAQHGIEVNGTEVLRRFHERLPLEDLAGTIIAVPIADPLTFDHVSYTTPRAIDHANPNMNRVWPGDEEGSLHERMAASLWDLIEDADALVDLHTGSPDMWPHVVYLEGDLDSFALAEAFGTDLALSEQANDDASEEWHDRNFSGKLRVAATEAGIPSITPELSHNKQILEGPVEDGVEGLLNVARHLDMLPGEPPERDQLIARNHLGRVLATESGLFRANPDLECGEYLESGTYVGTVYHPTTYEPLQEGVTERDGILYAHRKESTVTSGSQLAGIALLRDEP